MYNNNIKQAVSRLREQSSHLGWTKATKLEKRQTTQKLINFTVENNCSALAESKCETDFVIKNDKFQELPGIAFMRRFARHQKAVC